MSSTFLFSLDNSIVAQIQPAIILTLGGVDKLAWLGVSFVLSTLATIIFWGKIMSVFSVKWAYITAILIFEIGSALCGAAPSMNAMIVGRAIAGVGGAGMYVGCLALLSMTTTIRERPVYMASIGFTWGAGTVLGPIVGGAFAENPNTTWRWSFYINLVGLYGLRGEREEVANVDLGDWYFVRTCMSVSATSKRPAKGGAHL